MTGQAPAEQELCLRTGPFVTHLVSRVAQVRDGLAQLYAPECLIERPAFCDFHVRLGSPGVRRWLRPKVTFSFEGTDLFTPSPEAHALPLFEWGLNWIIATTVNQYLIVHAAVVERGGRALILPGEPGAGKSTLCAGLAYRGWRLLSDELALIVPETGALVALARPISLKNESADVVRRFAPDAVLSTPAAGTTKGTIVLAKPPAESARRVAETARPGWVVFARYERGAPTRLAARPKAECFIELAVHSMNYSVLGEQGFSTLADVIDGAQCFEFSYSDLEDGVRRLTELSDAA